ALRPTIAARPAHPEAGKHSAPEGPVLIRTSQSTDRLGGGSSRRSSGALACRHAAPRTAPRPPALRSAALVVYRVRPCSACRQLPAGLVSVVQPPRWCVR